MTYQEATTTDEPSGADAPTADQGTYGLFELSKLRASPDNRKRFNEQALQELAASITAMGVAQAILIRPVTPTAEAPEEFEIVAGERRFRASKIAGKTHIPALCRNLSDLDAAKIRILENLQREDPHPMEEAEGYQLLMLQHGFSADQLVDEVKKSRAYIYGRLKLCALTPEVREQFLDNKISASTALLIARIPVPALQIKAAQEVLNPYGTGEAMSHRNAANHIQGRYMLKLSAAAFSITDAKLLATAGACTKCPKRTGNQPEIFEGIDANVCTDPDCFAEKRAAHGAALLVQANKQGIPVLEGDEASQTLSRRYNQDSELVTADMNLWYFKRNAPSTQNNGHVNDFLRGDALPAVASYVKRDDGTLTPLYKRADVQAALEACDACETVEAHAERMAAAKAADPAAAAKEEAEHKKTQARQALIDRENTYRVALYKQLRQHASVGALGLSSLREFVKAVAEENCLDASLHDLYESDVSTDLDRYIDTADAGALQLLLIDLVLGHHLKLAWYDLKNDGSVDDEGGFATVVAMARHEGVDVDAVRAEAYAPPAPTAVDEPAAPAEEPQVGTEPGAEGGTESQVPAIDVSNMQYDDLVEFIKAKPEQINELTDAVLACVPRHDLIGLLEQAAGSLGYVYQVGGFALVAAEAATEGAAAPVDQVKAMPAVIDQVEEPPAPGANDDAEDLPEQLATVEAAAQPVKQPKAKSAKAKSAAKDAPASTAKKAAKAKPAATEPTP